MRILCSSLLAVLLLIVGADAQEPDPESLVQSFIEHGMMPGGWIPAYAFEGCTDLEPWQTEAFRLLRDATLTAERLDDLALALSGAFADCGNGALESWYLAETERLAAADNSFWTGIRKADNARVMAKLYEWMAADAMPVEFRNRAAGEYFLKLNGDEAKLRAFVAAHERGILPTYHAGSLIQSLAVRIPDRTLSEMGRLAREQPDRLLNDPVFELLFSRRTLRNASSSARARFTQDIRAAIDAAPGLSSDRRGRLEAALAGLGERPD